MTEFITKKKRKQIVRILEQRYPIEVDDNIIYIRRSLVVVRIRMVPERGKTRIFTATSSTWLTYFIAVFFILLFLFGPFLWLKIMALRASDIETEVIQLIS